MNLLLTDEEIQKAWPDDIVTITPILTLDDIERELVRCAQVIAKAQLDKVLEARLDRPELRERMDKMNKMDKMDKFKLVDISEVPVRWEWQKVFNELPIGKAGMLKYNNRQRAHQIAAQMKAAANYRKIVVKTRIIHAEPPIHDEEGWLLYFWKPSEE